MDDTQGKITCNQFLWLILTYTGKGESLQAEEQAETKTDLPDSLEKIKKYGRNRGWLEEQEILFGERKIERRQAARILHEYLKTELHEKDNEDWQNAMKLQDLFDCRSCVNHVAQMYVKGIMTAYEEGHSDTVLRFGMRNLIQREEAEEILERVFFPEKRIRTNTSICEKQDGRLTYEEACSMMTRNADYMLVDVRSESVYMISHIEQAVSIPLCDIFFNPVQLEEMKDKTIFLYCDKGCQSEIARVHLKEQGYQHVFSFGCKQD